jgi:alpha-galactosidase
VVRGFARDGAQALVEGVTDAPVVIEGQQIVLGDREDEGVFFAGARSEEYRGGIRLSLVFNLPELNARVLRNFAAYPGTPVVESWFEVERLDGDQPVEASSLAAWRVGVNGRDLRWRHGLEMGGDPDVAFREEVRTLGEGEVVEIGSPARSTQTTLPWITVSTPAGTLFAGLMWSGPWRLTARGDASGVQVDAGLVDTTSTVPAGQALEGPHGFFGVVDGGDAAVAAAMRTFLVDGLRAGRGFPALVTYNTWFSHGVQIDDGIVAREAHEAALAGVELFQLDAGWYPGAGRTGRYDFTSGLGTWEVDSTRFRRGLRGVADVVHDHGMRFGLWVEPERVDLSQVGGPGGPPERWLATNGGAYRPGFANEEAGHGQICLAHPDAYQWVLAHLARLVEQDGVDYLKIDLNDWVNCTRDGHGHGPADGPFAHVRALYRLLETLRQRFPELLIENCAGGGNRIDLGLARFTDAGWMDDRTTPSAHVRHNFHGLASMLPPSYLLSYVMAAEGESLDTQGDVALLTRSRMGGVLGLAYSADEVSEGGFVMLEREVAVYKRVRDLVGTDSVVLHTAQPSTDHGPD